MSAEQGSVTVAPNGWALTPYSRKVVRYSLGATLGTSLALGIGWPLSFLTCILSLGFLAAPAPLGFRAGLNLVATVIVACLAALFFTHYLIPFPLVYIPFIGLVLFRIFYAKAGGASPLMTTWLLITFMALPLLGLLHQAVPNAVAGGIVISVSVMVVVVWLTWALIPNPPGVSPTDDPDHGHAPEPATASEKLRGAALSIAVVLPAVAVFYTLQWTGGLLVLIFIALLSSQPNFAGNFKTGVALIIGNIIGGLAAIIYYELLVMVPVFPFMLLLALLMGLIFGGQLFSGKKTGPLFGMAYSTALLIIVSTTSGTGDADAKAPTRVIQLLMAVTYVVVAFGLIERFRHGRKEST